jgi:undecaprenyl-diphosphatase
VDNLSALIYGIIQGLTEFLPVSSSGHLALLPYWLNIKDPGIVFDLAMHVGTAFSIAYYFRKKIKGYSIDLCTCLKAKKVEREQSVAFNMVIVTMATFIFALAFKPMTEQYGRDPMLIGINLIIFGIFMWFADRFGKTKEKVSEQMKWPVLLGYGLFQSLALFPGVSRSGITLTYSRLIGMSREEATSFSFLLALPLICAGFILKLPTLADPALDFDLKAFALGLVTSFVVGLATIHFFLKWVKKVGLGIFALYRVVLALVIFSMLG